MPSANFQTTGCSIRWRDPRHRKGQKARRVLRLPELFHDCQVEEQHCDCRRIPQTQGFAKGPIQRSHRARLRAVSRRAAHRTNTQSSTGNPARPPGVTHDGVAAFADRHSRRARPPAATSAATRTASSSRCSAMACHCPGSPGLPGCPTATSPPGSTSSTTRSGHSRSSARTSPGSISMKLDLALRLTVRP